jgi:trehalose synthase
LRDVYLERRSLDEFRDVVDDVILESLVEAARPLEGLRLVHVNSTSFGGGVAEILQSLVPFMRDLGLDAQWKVIDADDEFFTATKALHNGLQGADVSISPEDFGHYLEVNRRNAEGLGGEWDFVIVHDPQPAAIVAHAEGKGRWIWRCHIDLSTPNAETLALLAPFLPHYDATVFSMDSYVPEGLNLRNPTIIHPSIDPFSDKNRPLSVGEVESIARRYGVDPERPILSSVIRFDPWKDPLGVIEVYRRLREQGADLQLLLISSMAHDDPEGWEYYERTLRRAGEDPDILFLTNLRGVGSIEVNALQRCSWVSLLKSKREGFGLVVSESLWKRVPVVGTRVGGIPLQVVDGETGFLVEGPEMAVERILRLLRDEALRERMGEAGRNHVKRRFLTTRHLRDYVDLLLSLKRGSTAA